MWFLTWCNHDFMLLGPYAEEGQIVGGIQFTDHTAGLVCQLTDQPCILDRSGIIQSGFYGNTCNKV